MLERWDALARFPYLGTVKVGNNDRSMDAAFGKDLAPRRNNQAVAVGFPAALVLAGLGSGQHKTAILNRSRTQQHGPVRLTGWSGESRGDRQEIGPCLGERAIKVGKPQVVANRQ